MRGKKGAQPLQRWQTAFGQPNRELPQQITDAVDASQFTDASVLLEVSSFVAVTPANLSLIVETAESVDTPDAAWEEIISTSATTLAHVYPSARPDATKHLLRWVRWRIAAGDCGNWKTTFRVCVTLR
jgi:hypothetical protein